MSENIDTRVSISLHPDNVTKLDGYDSETEAILAPTMTAFSEAYEGLRKVHDAKAAADRNPTWNDAQKVVVTDDYAQKQFARIAKGFDATRANLEKGIASIEQELSRPVESSAANAIAVEVRAHIKGLSVSERMTVIQQAINEGDHIIAQAALGAPAMLSGLDPQMQKVLSRQYHERHNQQASKRLKAMKAAKAMIEDRGGLVFKEMEKAVGMRADKVKALRDAKNAAEQAFILKDA
ncbi:hypothetical protein [Rhizobium sp. ICMP 5592]|uniref:hypothetical protein n=1 Tax=Rhizobium sp. ICMP 5592 TaxID=2292445 RepID=UPI0012954B08|nr:hypothetical protein [Rhizobium sp. ICMP 5592]MQB43031.1 hypothetical protein [Rhizobium sp. ICMP 5592]